MSKHNKYAKLYKVLKTQLVGGATIVNYIDNLLSNADNNCNIIDLDVANKLSISDLKYYKCSQKIFNNDDQVTGGQNSEVFKINVDGVDIIVKKQPFFYVSNNATKSTNFIDLKNNLLSDLHNIQNPAIRDLVFTKKLSDFSNIIPHFPILYKYFVLNDVINKVEKRNMLVTVSKIIEREYNQKYYFNDIEKLLLKTPVTTMEHKLQDFFNFYGNYGIQFLFLVMEKLDDTLEGFFEKNPMRTQEILIIILQVFMSLYYLKSGNNNQGIKNYVHCDLHLLNVMYVRGERNIEYNYNGKNFKMCTNFVCKIIDNGTSGGIIDGITILPCYLREADISKVIEDAEIFKDFTNFLDHLFNNGNMGQDVANEIIEALGKNFKPNELKGRYYFSMEYNFNFMEDLISSCINYNLIK